MKSKDGSIEPSVSHVFKNSGAVVKGKAWGTTSLEKECKYCNIKYFHGIDKKPIEDCPKRVRIYFKTVQTT